MQRFVGAVAAITLLVGCGTAGSGSSTAEGDTSPETDGPILPIDPPSIESPDPTPIETLAESDLSAIPAWSRGFEGSNFQCGYSGRFDIVTDRAGNLIIAGDFKGAVNLGKDTLQSAGEGDILVAKFDASGRLLWSKLFGDAADQIFSGVAVDPAGNVVLTGVFGGTVDFGKGPLTASYMDMFLARLDPQGKALWSRSFGSQETIQWAQAVTTDRDGNVILAGSQEGEVDYGGLALKTSGSFLFTVKFSPAGLPLWGKTFGGSVDQEAVTVATDAAGNVVLAGTSETITIDGVKLPGKGLTDIFAVKWNAGGKLQWAQHFGDADDQMLSTAALDADGNLVLGGTYRGYIDFPGAPLRNPSRDAYEFFVAKIGPSGEARYSQSFPTGGSVAVGKSGEVIIAGSFEGTTHFGDRVLQSAGGTDLFVVKLNAAGQPVASASLGGSLEQTFTSMTVDPAGRVLLFGAFAGDMNLGSGALSSKSGQDLFLAKLPR